MSLCCSSWTRQCNLKDLSTCFKTIFMLTSSLYSASPLDLDRSGAPRLRNTTNPRPFLVDAQLYTALCEFPWTDHLPDPDALGQDAQLPIDAGYPTNAAIPAVLGRNETEAEAEAGPAAPKKGKSAPRRGVSARVIGQKVRHACCHCQSVLQSTHHSNSQMS